MSQIDPSTPDATPALPDDDVRRAIEATFDTPGEADFEHLVRQAVDPLPAQFLFHMRIELEPALDVAALMTTGAEAARFLIVRRSAGEAVRVEPADESDLPIANLAPAYAGLAGALPLAA